MSGYYTRRFDQAKAEGLSDVAAAETVATALLDGKPAGLAAGRHAAFWTAGFIRSLPRDAWTREAMVLALARYLSQDVATCPDIVAHVADLAPEVVRRAARYAGLVGRQDSLRWREVEALADTRPAEFADFVRLFGFFRQAREERVAEVERLQQSLAALTPLEMLVYASLYAFERLVPAELALADAGEASNAPTEHAWNAIDAILAWTLATCAEEALQPDERAIGRALRAHLSPFLFPSHAESPQRDLYAAFCALVSARIELDEHDARSADAFSYDDSVRFVAREGKVDMAVVDAHARQAWESENARLARLHEYWMYRGMEELLARPDLAARAAPANLEANLQALASALRTWLRLQEVYGVGEQATTEAGSHVDVFEAIKAIELMAAFHREDFIDRYARILQQEEHPWRALGRLAFEGLSQGENRFPLTWSDRACKIARLQPWTASDGHPQGQPYVTGAVLDFWTSDWNTLAERLRTHDPGIALRPRLQERPILKMGQTLFQLPWMLAMQNNSTAAINNLRRLGMRRTEVREETRRIERRLGHLFAERGFSVLVGHELPVGSAASTDVEEIDLLCARDGSVLILELKSSFFRRSMKEAWMHRTTTLRKAGQQLRRKAATVRRALADDGPLRQALGISAGDGTPDITAWIVDTSIECDHERFDGFLKVSLEEVLIALRDDRHWLDDPDGLFCPADGTAIASRPVRASLYPQGFTAGRFKEAIESEAVWATE